MLPPPALPGFGGESVLSSALALGFGGQWQQEQFLQQLQQCPLEHWPSEFLQRMAEEAERRRLEAEAVRAARAFHRSARTKGDPESDDDEMLRATLEAERLSVLVSSTRTDSAEDDLSYTESNWAVHKRSRSWPSTRFYSSTTPIDEAHSSFEQAG